MSLLKPGVEPFDTHDLRVRREFREILGAPGCGEKSGGGQLCTILHYAKLDTFYLLTLNLYLHAWFYSQSFL